MSRIQLPSESTLSEMTGPSSASGDADHIGQVFGGKYRIIDEIGKGGMGRIFAAEQISLRRTVAIKVITASHDVEANKRFLLEASLTANLDHPNIVKVHDFGSTDAGTLFLVMELLTGENLKCWVENHGPLSVEDALKITQQLCGALSEAHTRNVIHRDIKPSNIVLTRPAGAGLTAKLIDFGLVKTVNDEGLQDQPGQVQGTPMFMAPEQITNSAVDDRVDIYALGLTMLFAISGRLPYPKMDLKTLLRAQLNERSPTLELLKEMFSNDHLIPWILHTAVEKEPIQRFQNALQMLQSVEVCQGFIHSDSFPALRMDAGVLKSDSGDLPSFETLSSAPAVVSGSYVEGGKALSDHFAQTLTMSGLYDTSEAWNPGFETHHPDRKTNLESMPNSFVGRQSEMETIVAYFDAGAQLVTVSGIGGTGKTRLVREVGHTQLEQYRSGVWFVDVAEASSLETMYQCVADALGFQLTAREPAQQIGNALHGRGELLLILDNLEQLLPDAAQCLGDWIKMAPDARFLITSRERLKLPDEQVLWLQPLNSEDSILLFGARATAARPDFVLSESNRAIVLEIVQRLDGISLAIELAAARCSILTPTQLLERLSQRFQLLQGTTRDKDHRQATLRNTIDWSWRLLAAHEQAALAQLSVCASRFTLETAESVVQLGEEQTDLLLVDVIQSLYEKSLIRRFSGPDDSNMFGLYQTIMAYAAERLGEGTADTRQRHMMHCVEICRAIRETPGKEAQDQAILYREYANLCKALDFAMEAQASDAVFELVTGVLAVLHRKGPIQEVVAKTDILLSLPDLQPVQRASMVCTRIMAMRKLTRVAMEETGVEEALEHAVEAGDLVVEAACHQAIIQLQEDKGAREGLVEQLQTIIRRFEDTNAPQHTFWFHYMLSDVYLHRGMQTEVEQSLKRAEAILNVHRNRAHRGVLTHQWGRYYEHHGHLDKARKQYQRGLNVYVKTGDAERQGMMMGCLANIHRTQGRYEEANVHYNAALRLYRQWGNLFRAAMVQGNKGNMLKEQESFDAALLAYQESGEVFERLGRVTHHAVSLGNLGDLLIRMERFEDAKEALEESIALCRQTSFKAEGAFLSYLARAHRLQGDFAAAEHALNQSESLLRETAQAIHLGVMLCEKGLLALEKRNASRARKLLAEAETIAEKMQANPQSDLGFAVASLRDALDQFVPWYKALFRRAP